MAKKKTKTYYWLKMKKGFLKRHDVNMIKRRLGFEGVYYYLALLLESIDHDGHLRFSTEVSYDTESLADAIDADLTCFTKLVRILKDKKMLVTLKNGTLYLPYVTKCIGSETESAERMRTLREKERTSHSDTDVTNSDTDVTPENDDISNSQTSHSDTEIEKEIEKEKEEPNLLVEDEEKKESPKPKKVIEFDEESIAYKLSERLYKMIKKNNEKAKKPNLQSWAKDMDLLMRADEKTKEEIWDNILYSQKDQFWHTVILSPKNLRKNFDRLTLKRKPKEKEQGPQNDFLEMAQRERERENEEIANG